MKLRRKQSEPDRVVDDLEELAGVIDESNNRWQHGIGSGEDDPDGLPYWIAQDILDSEWFIQRETRLMKDFAEFLDAKADAMKHDSSYRDGLLNAAVDAELFLAFRYRWRDNQ